MVKDTKDEDRRLAEDILFSYAAKAYHWETRNFGNHILGSVIDKIGRGEDLTKEERKVLRGGELTDEEEYSIWAREREREKRAGWR